MTTVFSHSVKYLAVVVKRLLYLNLMKISRSEFTDYLVRNSRCYSALCGFFLHPFVLESHGIVFRNSAEVGADRIPCSSIQDDSMLENTMAFFF